MVTRRKIDFWNFIRFILIAICVLIFYLISHELVANWLAKEVVTTQKWDRNGTLKALQPPLIAVCAQDPFRENTAFEEMYHVQKFMEYSVNVTDTQLRDLSITSSSTTQSSQVLKKWRIKLYF